MSKPHRKRRYRSAREIQEVLAAFEASGLSQAAFARSRGVSPTSLNNWIRRWRRPGETATALVPVHVVPGGPSTPPFEVRLGNRRIVRVPSGFDAAELRRLLAAVESC